MIEFESVETFLRRHCCEDQLPGEFEEGRNRARAFCATLAAVTPRASLARVVVRFSCRSLE
jgi:hypothetical protein